MTTKDITLIKTYLDELVYQDGGCADRHDANEVIKCSIALSLDRIAAAQERLADSLRDVKLRESLDKIEYNLTQIRW